MESTMGLTANLAMGAAISVKNIGSLELIASENANALLAAAAELKVAVVGIEGFRIVEGRAIPDVDAIADFSDLARDDRTGARTVEEARQFLRRVSRHGMYFDFALDETISGPPPRTPNQV